MEEYKKQFQTTPENLDKPYYNSYSKKKKEMSRKMISIPKKELVAEHRDLVKDLKSGSRAKMKAELRKQTQELTNYIKY